MPTTTFLPTGNSEGLGRWPEYSFSAVDDDDGDSSYAYRDSTTGSVTAQRCLWSHGSLPAWAARIIRVQVTYRDRFSTTEDVGVQILASLGLGGSYNDGTAYDPSASLTYSTRTETFAQAPGSLAWTPGRWNSTAFGVKGDRPTTGGNELRVSYCYATVEWATSFGSFVYELGAVGLWPLVGLLAREVPALARELAARSRRWSPWAWTRVSPGEWGDLYRAARAPRAAYFLA